MWYQTAYRRHLCDMHIEDWDAQFLSQFSPEKYVQDLITAKVQNPMIYLQSHVGLCYYPTNSGQMHKALIGQEDLIKQTIDLCREKGMPVVGYYSLIFNTRAHDAHPSWRMRRSDGMSQRENPQKQNKALEFSAAPAYRYGLCCPNNPEYQQFVYTQVREILDYFTLEGLFFDMPFWEHTCYCPHCRARWESEVGGAMPLDDPTDPTYPTLLTKKRRWMGQFIQSVTDLVKSIDPRLSVEYNYAAAISHDASLCCGFEVAQASDFVGGDLYGGIYNHSAACKFYKNITKNQPFDYMFSRCKPRLSVHTLTKTKDQLLTEVMATAAHHGASMVIDALDPVGTTDSRFYKTMGEVFDFESRYEPYFGGAMVEDIGIYYNPTSRYNPRGEEYHMMPALKQVTKTLICHHIPFGVTGSFHTLNNYQILVAPSITDLDSADFDRLESYVRQGGSLYLSGLESAEFITRILDCEILGRTEENHIYIAPASWYEELFLGFCPKYPLPFPGTAPLIKPSEDSEILATLTLPYTDSKDTAFASIHSNPPGIATAHPLIIKKSVGKGTVIWSAVNLEAVDIYEYGRIFTNLMRLFRPSYAFSATASKNVELTMFRQEARILVHAVHMTEEEYVTVEPPFTVSVATDAPPKQVLLAPDHTPIPFTYHNGYTTFTARELRIYDLYLLEIS